MGDNKEFVIGSTQIFLSSWPYGKLRTVKILGLSPYIKNGIYIRYLDTGGSDTTTPEFLFNPPENESG